jgi:pimeloyl-ACP methyl ester carboxylesterase
MWSNLAVPFLGRGLSFHPGPLPGEPEGETFAEIDGVRLRYIDAGKGQAVLFIHGFAASLEMWRRTFRGVATRNRALAIDLKGFGWSARPRGDYSHEAQVTLLWKFLDARGVQTVALLGHSWGAAVALAMALQAPDRVQCIALYAAWVYQEQIPAFLPFALGPWVGESLFSIWFQQRTRYRLALAFHDLRYMTHGLVADVEQMMSLPGSAAGALAALRAMDFAAQQRRYPRLEMPAMLLWGRDDWVTPVRVAERLRGDLRARVCVYPSCGHLPMIEAARASNRDLAAFLAENP